MSQYNDLLSGMQPRFKLPPNVIVEKRRLYNGQQAHVFIHDTLGELGRIRYVGMPNNQTNIQIEISGTDLSDPITQQKKKIFEPIAKACMERFDSVLGSTGTPAPPQSLEQQEPRIIPSEILPCLTCGSPAAMAIFSSGTTKEVLEKDERAMEYKIKTINIPTWVIGQEKEVCINGKLDGQALSLKVWPQKEPETLMLADDFYKKLEFFQKEHCKIYYLPDSQAYYQRMGNDYLGWRAYLEGMMGEMQRQFPATSITTMASKELNYFHSFYKNNATEQAVVEDYALFHYRENRTSWIETYFKTYPIQSKDGKQHIAKAIKNAYFTGLKVLDVLDEDLGVMRVYDLVYQRNYFFVDQAFCHSFSRAPCFMMMSTVIDTGTFLLTTGAGIPIQSETKQGKMAISLLNKYTKEHVIGKPLTKASSFKCTTEFIKYCLNERLLSRHTLNYFS